MEVRQRKPQRRGKPQGRCQEVSRFYAAVETMTAKPDIAFQSHLLMSEDGVHRL